MTDPSSRLAAALADRYRLEREPTDRATFTRSRASCMRCSPWSFKTSEDLGGRREMEGDGGIFRLFRLYRLGNRASIVS